MVDAAALHQKLSEALANMAVPVPVKLKIDEVFAEAQTGKTEGPRGEEEGRGR